MTQFYTVCFALFCLLVFLGCATDPDIDSSKVFVSSTDALPDDKQLWGKVTVADPTRNAWGTDTYVVNDPPSITGDVLTLSVSYSGGCEAHNFTLITSGGFLESNPVQLQAVLAHDANGESCEAWVTETYHFNVSPLKTRYQKAYRTETGTIALNIKGISALVYTF
ncbi:hypothetical protein F4X88_01610 [Candidatus Poribacteria bacterium]|nr:hypothetical protein [Candidatus Poribacteria bacterium]MYA54968.1 hypothetical protein [Candidatus Poribacteria bacterium]